MGDYRMDNGEAFMRAMREAQQQARQQAQSNQNPYLGGLAGMQVPSLTPRAWTGPVTPGERPEPEDTTGLKMLEEFLAKRKGARDD